MFGQDDYYITITGDSVKCQIRKVFPNEIKVKKDDKENISLDAREIKGFLKGGILFVSKEITNKPKKTYIILPDGYDREIDYDQRFKVGARGWVDVNVVVRSGNGIKFYELTEKQLNQNPPRWITTLYIENDSLGLRAVPYLSAIGGSAEKIDVINALYDYLRDNDELEKNLALMNHGRPLIIMEFAK